jgi:hypothetical protein
MRRRIDLCKAAAVRITDEWTEENAKAHALASDLSFLTKK